MNRRGATLVELMASLAVAALLVFISGKLLFAALESWRIQADRDTSLRRSTLSLDRLAADLASQPDWPELSAPVEAFSLGSDQASISFFMSEAGLKSGSVCWYLSGDGPWTLLRCAAGTEATEAALPDNAAGLLLSASLENPESTYAASALSAASVVACRGVVSLELDDVGEGAGPQLFLCVRTPEGVRRIESGEAASLLPARCTIRSARPVLTPDRF